MADAEFQKRLDAAMKRYRHILDRLAGEGTDNE